MTQDTKAAKPRYTTYKFLSVRQATRYQAQRMAVLSPLFGGQWRPAEGEDAVAATCKYMAALTGLWRRAAVDLHKARWPSLASEAKLNTALSCPPFGVNTDHPRRFTCRQALCPFCFARRRVMTAFCLLERFFYTSTKPDTEAQPGGWYLTEFVRRYDMHPAPWSLTTVQHWAHHYALRSIALPAARRREFLAAEAEHGVVQFQVDIRAQGVLRGTRRGLLLTRAPVTAAQIDLPEKYAQHFRCTALADVPKLKSHLAVACATVCAYPAGLLRAPAPEVMAVLMALKGRRLHSVYGFQAQKQRKT